MKYNLFLTATMIMVSLLITSTGCKKNKQVKDTSEQLPPETQTGAYTFGCKVDGVIYKASGKDGLLAKQYVNYGYFSSDSSFIISASSIKDKKFTMNIAFKCRSVLTDCLISIYPYTANFIDNSNGTLPNNTNSYSTNKLHKGKAIIKYFNGTIAPGNFGTIASGVFEMEAVNSNGKVIKITEGRFDTRK
jgi:hypothetical protein